jgi:hypothetical protein
VRHDEAGEDEERGDRQVSAAQEGEQGVRQGQGGGGERLAGPGEVVQNDPQDQEEAESGERRQVGWASYDAILARGGRCAKIEV